MQFKALPSFILLSAGLLFPLPAAEPPAIEPKPYTRVHWADENKVELQIASKRFQKGKDDPALWLVGVSHVGDTNYYKTLQEHLGRHSLVLFEGVDFENRKNEKPELDPSLQSNIAKSLGLVFQLDSIDYTKANFKNSDLNLREMQLLFLPPGTKLVEEGQAGGAPVRTELNELVDIMEGNSLLGVVMNGVVNAIGASPRLQSLSRFMMIQMLGSLRGDLGESPVLGEQFRELFVVLIKKRNEKVLSDVKTAMSKGRKSIAVFYGAGHMDDLEKRVRTELGYAPAEEIWFTAFDVDLGKAGITRIERALIETTVSFQMQLIQGK